MHERRRLPEWVVVDGIVYHSFRPVGVSLAEWVGDENSGMTEDDFKQRFGHKLGAGQCVQTERGPIQVIDVSQRAKSDDEFAQLLDSLPGSG